MARPTVDIIMAQSTVADTIMSQPTVDTIMKPTLRNSMQPSLECIQIASGFKKAVGDQQKPTRMKKGES